MASAPFSDVLVAFSDLVMRGPRNAEPAAGMEAMQILHREVFSTIFMAVLVGMTAISPFWAAFAWFNLTGISALSIAWAGSLYFVGVFGATLLFNVPMNNRFDKPLDTNAESQGYWKLHFYPRWTIWNHIRIVAAGAAAIGYLLGCISLVGAA